MVKRRIRVYIINKKIQNLKQDKNKKMDDEVTKIPGIILPNLYFGAQLL